MDLARELSKFREFGQSTRETVTESRSFEGDAVQVPTYVNEFWTARQRQAHSLHEISYRACFKPQLPRFFIERLTAGGDVVYDPFMGRGTSLLEAALLSRVPWGCDVNPLSRVLLGPRLTPPTLEEISARLRQIDLSWPGPVRDDLLAFYHPETLRALTGLREYFLRRRAEFTIDPVDEWLCMVALNRLTGHSAGFFSVYTLPPNQAVSIKSQIKINTRRNQTPPPRDLPRIILKKSRNLLQDCNLECRATLARTADKARLVTADCRNTPGLPANSVSLVVTSPPFLNVVDYATDNWLRCWFLGVEAGSVELSVPKKLDAWQQIMTGVFRELHRLLRPGGHVAFEVGEVHGGKTKLEEAVISCGLAAGLNPLLVLINDQEFTKTANCWGVNNNSSGTNTNRIVVLRKA